MSSKEFAVFIKTYSNIWGVNFDESKIRTWFSILEGLKIKGLIAALNSLAVSRTEYRDNNGKVIKKDEYPPTIKEIVERYDELKQIQEKEIREKKIAEAEKHMLMQTEGQYKCPICANTGDYIYKVKTKLSKIPYDYYCRCICAKGKDLNKWSEYQITKDKLWTDPVSNKQRSIYVADLRDIFTDEEIEIIKIKKMSISENYNFIKGREKVQDITNMIADKLSL